MLGVKPAYNVGEETGGVELMQGKSPKRREAQPSFHDLPKSETADRIESRRKAAADRRTVRLIRIGAVVLCIAAWAVLLMLIF